MSEPKHSDFHCFFAYNSADREAAVEVADRLRRRYGLRIWLDAWQLPAGQAWRPAIVAAIKSCSSFAVMFGAAGWGKNHVEEVREAIRFTKNATSFNLIPVLLPGADETKIGEVETDDALGQVLVELFSSKHRIDFRTHGTRSQDRVAALAAGILGKAPGAPRLSWITIEEDADEWNRGSRMDKVLLYRGETLRRAVELMQTRASIEEPVGAFLATSQWQEKLRGRILASIITAALLIAGLALAADHQRREANLQRRQAEANANEALRQRTAAEASERRAVANAREATAQRLIAEAATAEANRLRDIAETERARAALGRQALLTYLISEETGMPDAQARGWAAAPTSRSYGAAVDGAVVEEWKVIISEVMLQPEVLRTIKLGHIFLIYLSLTYDADIGYTNALPLLRASRNTPRFRTRLTHYANHVSAMLTESGMAAEARYYSLDALMNSASSEADPFMKAALQSLLFSEAQMAQGASDAGRYVAQWRESEEPSPEEFRRAFSQFRASVRQHIATLEKTLKFWNVKASPDPDNTFRRIMGAAGRAMAASGSGR